MHITPHTSLPPSHPHTHTLLHLPDVLTRIPHLTPFLTSSHSTLSSPPHTPTLSSLSLTSSHSIFYSSLTPTFSRASLHALTPSRPHAPHFTPSLPYPTLSSLSLTLHTPYFTLFLTYILSSSYPTLSSLSLTSILTLHILLLPHPTFSRASPHTLTPSRPTLYSLTSLPHTLLPLPDNFTPHTLLSSSRTSSVPHISHTLLPPLHTLTPHTLLPPSHPHPTLVQLPDIFTPHILLSPSITSSHPTLSPSPSHPHPILPCLSLIRTPHSLSLTTSHHTLLPLPDILTPTFLSLPHTPHSLSLTTSHHVLSSLSLTSSHPLSSLSLTTSHTPCTFHIVHNAARRDLTYRGKMTQKSHQRCVVCEM